MEGFSERTTLLTHIFNEEYLLPFWLQHHKNMFDDIVIVDYNSTDKSIEICKTICPTCKIIKTRNEWFDAVQVDREIMDIEDTITGIKIVLNVTEFLFCETSIKDLFENNNNLLSYGITSVSPFSKNIYNINSLDELFKNLFNDDVVFQKDTRIRSARYIHNHPNGSYHVGRHNTNHNSLPTNNAHIIWFGYYPMNEHLMKRKLQIKQNISENDKQSGLGYHHLLDRSILESLNVEATETGKKFKDVNEKLYNLLCNYKVTY
jgi:hypothetical protein